MKKKVWLGMVLLLVMSLCFTACGQKEADKKEPETGLYQAYIDHLNANKEAIKNYIWQTDKDNQVVSKNVALYDLNKDGTPELIYVAAEDPITAYLHICTYGNGAVTDQEYETKSTWPADNGGVTTEKRLKDSDVGGGTKFILCDTTTAKHFYIGFSQSDSYHHCDVNEYEMDENGKITLVKTLSNHTVNEGDEGSDFYWINQESVSWDKGTDAFKKAGDQYKQVVVYSGNVDNMSLFQKIASGDEIALSFDAMVAHLNKLMGK